MQSSSGLCLARPCWLLGGPVVGGDLRPTTLFTAAIIIMTDTVSTRAENLTFAAGCSAV